MNKNIKRIFLFTTLLILLFSVSIVSATDDNNNTTDVISEKASVDTHSNDVVIKEEKTNNPEKEKSTTNSIQKIEKQDKNLKTSSITINGKTYDNVIENQELKNTDGFEVPTYLNNCTIIGDEAVTFEQDIFINNCTINIEPDNYDGPVFITVSETYLNNTKIINGKTINVGTLYINNSFLDIIIHNINTCYIDDNTQFGKNCEYYDYYEEDKGITYTNNTYFNTETNILDGNINDEEINNLGSVIDGIYVIKNHVFDNSPEFHGDITLINCTIASWTSVDDILELKNCTINISAPQPFLAVIENYGTIYIDKNTQIINGSINNDNGKIINDERIVLKGTVENKTINSDLTNTNDAILKNCNITAQIINNGVLTLVNCSLSNNDMSVSGSKTDGFLINNNGNITLVDCVIENNTFNSTSDSSQFDLCGAIVNTGYMNITNLHALNNRVGYVKITDEKLLYANVYGSGAVITNDNGHVFIDNSTFEDNYAGFAGGAINNIGGKLQIQNSIFKNNTVSTHGGAIYNQAKYTRDVVYGCDYNITNTEFTENKVYLTYNTQGAGGGAIGFDPTYRTNTIGYIDNCTFNSNDARFSNAQSLAGVGAGGKSLHILTQPYHLTNSIFINTTINIAGTYYTMPAGTKIINNTFIQTQLSDYSEADIINNTFKNNSKLYIVLPQEKQTKEIKNNIFQDNNVEYNTIDIRNKNNLRYIKLIIQDNQYINTTINDTLELNIPNKVYTGENITITGTYTINDPDNYGSNILDQNKFNVYINGVLNQTVDTLEFTVTPTVGTMIVTVQPTVSQTRKSTSIRSTTLSNIIVTPENYDEYIYEGTLIGVAKDTKISFQGQFTDKGEITLDTNDIIIDGSDATFTNTTFILENENITLQNINITNTNTFNPVYNYHDNNIIVNNTLTLTTDNSESNVIYNQASNTLIANNTLVLVAPAGSIDFSTGNAHASTTTILLLGGNNNIIENNKINSTSTIQSGYGTLEAITNSNGATNTIIRNNTINIKDANFNYAIDCLNKVENISITGNTITVTGERYCDGIQVGNNAHNIIVDNNNITCICINTTELDSEGAITYGVIATSMGGIESNNITITENNINITGTVNYAIELYKVNNTEIHNNNITVNGPFSMGIGYAYSPNGNATGNTITITGDSTTLINMITEEFKPENVGIRIQNGTMNISLTDNTITTSDIGGQSTTIHTEPDNVTIANNKLISSQGYGNETIKAPTTATIENNIIETNIIIIKYPEYALTNTPITLTAKVTDEFDNPINNGSVIFTKVDELATAQVINGSATVTVTFTTEEDVTIHARYIPKSTDLSESQFGVAFHVGQPVAEVHIDTVTLITGETVTLTATVTDQLKNNINGERILFKANGKTIKDANGKVIYAKVVNGIATIEYTVPKTGNDVNITACYSGNKGYNKANETVNFNLIKKETTLTVAPIEQTKPGSTITLTATLNDNTINTGKIVFKINGKTVKDTNGKVLYLKVVNGQVSTDYTLPASYKVGNHTITATYIPNGEDRIETNSTLTVSKA